MEGKKQKRTIVLFSAIVLFGNVLLIIQEFSNDKKNIKKQYNFAPDLTKR